MSKHHVSHTRSRVLHDIDSMTNEALENNYDIEIDEDGVIWDTLEAREFANITEWGQFMAELETDENYGGTAKVNGKWKFDDERF